MAYNISHAQGELLAQIRPADTNPNLAYQTAELRSEITLITAPLIPSAGASVNVSIWHDPDGSNTFTDDTLIWYETRNLLTQSPILFQAQHPGSGIMLERNAQLAVGVSVANEVNFSLYGITETLSDRMASR